MKIGVVKMSYHFNTQNYSYKYVEVDKKFFEEEYQKYFSAKLEMDFQIQTLLIHVRKSYEFAIKLFEEIEDEERDTDHYEEVDFKLNNCNIYMENNFKLKVDELFKGVYYSESNQERFSEILASYIEITIRTYDSVMDNKLDQIGRIATGIRGLLDDLKFTLELNDLFNLKINESQSIVLEDIAYEYEKIKKEQSKLTLLNKDLICA